MDQSVFHQLTILIACLMFDVYIFPPVAVTYPTLNLLIFPFFGGKL
jgi:hypothetical protein